MIRVQMLAMLRESPAHWQSLQRHPDAGQLAQVLTWALEVDIDNECSSWSGVTHHQIEHMRGFCQTAGMQHHLGPRCQHL